MIKRRLLAPGLLAFTVLLSACGDVSPTPTSVVPPMPTAGATDSDLAGIKTYLLGKIGTLKSTSEQLSVSADSFYDLAKSVNFDYSRLWSEKQADAVKIIKEAREHWIAASPAYEQAEGIVAGTPSLSNYDVIIDAGASGTEDPTNAAPINLTLPNGKVLTKPGNLFGVTESTLWGTFADYTVPGVKVDFDGDGTTGFGDVMPDANVLKAGADALAINSSDLYTAAEAWTPTAQDAFTALVVMVPTMSEYFNSWKNSRFVEGNASQQRDFVVISRLADMGNILGGLQIVYGEVSPMVSAADPAADKQIATGMQELKTFVQGVYDQEKGGKKFTPEEADTLGEEAQNRATAIAGQISQVAAQLKITIEE
ncbi:MAG: imelysin family protein [Chloroflexia bacterium]